MKKLYNICEQWIYYGKRHKGLPPYIMNELVEIYNSLCKKEHMEFISFDIKKVLDSCNIMIAPKGVGWIVIG